MASPNPIDSSISIDSPEISSKYPTKILETDICKLWFLRDSEPHQDSPEYYFHFESPLAFGSAENTTLRTLLRRSLNNVLYDLDFDVTWLDTATGLELKMDGRTIEPITDILIERLASIGDITEVQFMELIEEHLHNNDFGTIDNRATDLRSYITPNHHASYFEIFPCISTLQLDDFQRYCSDYFKQIHVEIFAYGDIDEEQALNTVNRLINGVKLGKINDLSSIPLKTLHLPIGSYYLRCKVTQPRCYNSAVQNFYSIGSDTLHSRAMLDLILSFLQPYNSHDFDLYLLCNEYPANEQGLIGYDMYAYFSESTHTAAYVDRFIEQIRYDLINLVDRMTDEQFVEKKSSLYPATDFCRFKESDWPQIKLHTYQFDVHDKKARYMAQVSKAAFLAFLREHCDQERHRKLSVQIIRDPDTHCGVEDGCFDECDRFAHRIIPKSKRLDHSTPERFLADLQDFKTGLEMQAVNESASHFDCIRLVNKMKLYGI